MLHLFGNSNTLLNENDCNQNLEERIECRITLLVVPAKSGGVPDVFYRASIHGLQLVRVKPNEFCRDLPSLAEACLASSA